MSFHRTFLFALLCVLIASAASAEMSSRQRFLAGLRDRGLFRLAETYCTEQLRNPDLDEPQRAELVIELARCLAEQAVGSPPALRQPLWQRAEQVCQEFPENHPGNPHLLLVRFQAALGLLTRGELARQEASLVGDNAQLIEEAKSSLHAAIGRLRQLSEQVEMRLREQSLAGRTKPGELDAVQLAALQTNINYQFARALRNQAQCFAADSPDRAHSFSRAVELLTPLAKLDVSEPLSWNSRLYLATCYRLLGDGGAARRQLGGIITLSPPPWVQLRVLAERVQLALAAENLPDALAIVAQGRNIKEQSSPQLDYAFLETYLAAWRLASRQGGGDQAKHWQSKAGGQVRLMDELYGPYWTRRAEMLLARYVRAAPGDGDLAMLVRAAESSFRSGRPGESIEAYRRAARSALEQGNTARAFELRYIAASIEHQRGRHAAASAGYAELAREMPTNPAAAEAHLLAIYHAAQLAREAPGDPLGSYEKMLHEHLRMWPDGPAADQVRRRLGRLREHRGDLGGAIEAYRSIGPRQPDFLADVEAVERCCKRLIENRKAAGEPIGQIATDAATWFESLVVGPGGRLPQRWSPVQRYAALTAARMLLDYTDNGYARAERILSSAIKGAADAPADWKSSAQALLVYSLAGGGRIAEASNVLGSLSAGPPQELLTLLEGLGRVGAKSPNNLRSQLADLQLRAVDVLRPRSAALDASTRRRIERITAEALAAAGRTSEAIRAYKGLAKSYPRNAEIQEAYAKLLSGQGDRVSLQAALSKWRELEKHSAAGSDRWFRAKYSEALIHYRLGDRKKAAKIITLLKLLHPELGGPAMKTQFEELLARCGG